MPQRVTRIRTVTYTESIDMWEDIQSHAIINASAKPDEEWFLEDKEEQVVNVSCEYVDESREITG